MESCGHLGFLCNISIIGLVLFCNWFKYKGHEFIRQDIWPVGCQYDGFHMCCCNCQFASAYDVRHHYKMASYHCWREHIIVVHVCLYLFGCFLAKRTGEFSHLLFSCEFSYANMSDIPPHCRRIYIWSSMPWWAHFISTSLCSLYLLLLFLGTSFIRGKFFEVNFQVLLTNILIGILWVNFFF